MDNATVTGRQPVQEHGWGITVHEAVAASCGLPQGLEALGLQVRSASGKSSADSLIQEK